MTIGNKSLGREPIGNNEIAKKFSRYIFLVMVRRCSVGRASACCKAGPSSILGSAPQGGFPTELTSDEDMERDLSEWRRINVLFECD